MANITAPRHELEETFYRIVRAATLACRHLPASEAAAELLLDKPAASRIARDLIDAGRIRCVRINGILCYRASRC